MTINEAIEKLTYLKETKHRGDCQLCIITDKDVDDGWVCYDVNYIRDFKEFCVDGRGKCAIEVIDENGSNQ